MRLVLISFACLIALAVAFVLAAPTLIAITPFMLGVQIEEWRRFLIDQGGWAFWIVPMFFVRLLFKKRKVESNPKWLAGNKAALEEFGPTPEMRAAKIDETFDKRQATIIFRLETGMFDVKFGRSLAVMPIREVEALRTIYHLHNLGMQPFDNFYIGRCSLIWGDGKATVYEKKREFAKGPFAGEDVNLGDFLGEKGLPGSSGGWKCSVEKAVNTAMQDLHEALTKNPDHPGLQALKSRFTGGGGDLLPVAPLKVSENGNPVGHGLILGLDDKTPTKRWYYDGEGSLITVAPTRSGKTEGQVYPNVLNYKGPMIILDIKGEIYSKTSKWRQQNVGPVLRFSPLDPVRTQCYNPLTSVRCESMYLWSDSGVLTDLMMVPSEGSSDGNSKFFEDGAHDVLHAAIAYTCLEKDPSKRPMSKVLDIIHGIGWTEFVAYLQARVDMPTLARAGGSLAAPIPEQTRATILRTAQGKMSAWMGELVERATAKSDWQPSDFRNGSNPTLYICINFGEMESMRSVLRTIIGQHINLLTVGEPPARTNPPAAPILFLLDEMPQLRRMPPIEQALVVGAGYGVKLWMFIQDIGQLKKEYPNAEGMMGNCAVRVFMNPALPDGTAQKLSDDIGFRESVLDGTRVKIVEPNVLAGPEFKDKVIVWATGMSRPARLQKNFAYLDQALTARMGGL